MSVSFGANKQEGPLLPVVLTEEHIVCYSVSDFCLVIFVPLCNLSYRIVLPEFLYRSDVGENFPSPDPHRKAARYENRYSITMPAIGKYSQTGSVHPSCIHGLKQGNSILFVQLQLVMHIKTTGLFI